MLVDGASKSYETGDDPLLLSIKLDDMSEYSNSPHVTFIFSVSDIVVSVVHEMACLGGVHLRCSAAMG